MNKFSILNKKKGFTMIELLVVIAIIALLSSVILVATRSSKEKAIYAKVLQYSASVKNVLGAYIVGEWKFEDNCNDSSGNGYNGTCTDLTFSPNNEIPELGKTAVFVGTTPKVDTGPDFIGTKVITICVWINPTGWGGNNYGRVLDNGKMLFYLSAENQMLRFTSDGIGNTSSAYNSIVLNKWQFICVNRKISSLVTFYINGLLSGSPDQYSGQPTSGTTNVIIGNNLLQSRVFNGKIDEVQIYNENLTITQIQKLYAEGTEKHGIVIDK